MFARLYPIRLSSIGLFFSAIVIISSFPSTVSGHGVTYHEFTPVDHRLGLNASAINCIVQDDQGLIWLGTDRGLFSFDGYQARQYPSPGQSGKDNTGVVYCALMVDTVRIWLGTDDGLLVFNTYTDSYETAPAGLPDNIRALARISDHSYWIGSLDGLYRYSEDTGEIRRYGSEALPHQAVYVIMRYDENNFYFGTYNGLSRFDLQTGEFYNISLETRTPSSNRLILSLLPDYDRNCIWIGVEGGLFRYNPSSEELSGVALFTMNSVKSLLLDNRNCLWAGTDNGLYIYDPDNRVHRLIRHDATNDRSLLNNVVWTIFEDREQNIWIGTDAGASLYIYNKNLSRHSISELTGSNEGNQIISLLADSKGFLWLGGTNGVIRTDPATGTSVWYQQNDSSHPLPHNKVRYLFEDADGDVWIATDGSICRFDNRTSQFVRYQIEDAGHQRNANWSYAISQDETHKLWIATCLGGLFVADKQKLMASADKSYLAERNYYSNDSPMGLSGNMLQFLALDGDRNMWIGTYRDGLNKIDRMNQKVIQYTTRSTGSTLPSDDVTAMIVDADNNLWVALRDFVVIIDPRKNTMKTINDARLTGSYINAMADDGKRIWMSMSSGLFFIEKSTFRIKQISSGSGYFLSVFYDSRNHRVIAGGINEYVEFDPETIADDDRQCDLFITSLRINDRLLQTEPSVDARVNQGRSIRFVSDIGLPHDLNNLSFTFSEFFYSQQQYVQYASKLKGLDNDWHTIGRGNNVLTYNNLPPGDYTLMLARIGSDGNPIPDPDPISITIVHPWYSTLVARLIYILLFTLLAAAVVNYFIVLNRLRYERIDKAKNRELTAHKIDFLTNISHELKTPLSLIIGPLGQIIEKTKPIALKDQLTDVRQNALKMSSLIQQIMEASRQEFDKFGLTLSKTDLVAFVNSSVSLFEKQLKGKSVTIVLNSDKPSVFIDVDLFKLEVIINNILSNASKFAPEGSVITIGITDLHDRVRLTVTDQGPGIDSHDLPHVFERYYQSRKLLPQNREGSGIGLSVVREYVRLHHGTVRVISDGMSGTSVEVELPESQEDGEARISPEAPALSLSREADSKPLVLIVEDNVEILSFVSKSLSADFRCLTARNGILGLEAAMERHPDIIVADLMMPEMDGLEMCRKLKDNVTTSLIPVIILTARDDLDAEKMGYRIGADAFISKPFDIAYLADRIQNMLKGRRMLVQKARQEAIIRPRENEVLTTSEKFLMTITQIIENEITNPALNVKLLGEKSGYSLKQIYRRIKTLTGQTAVDYIRSVRLKKAAMLLSHKTFTVAEVMYMVGFSNHSYFSKRFREMFGKTPMQYASEGKHQT